jgi:hypothetical protein
VTRARGNRGRVARRIRRKPATGYGTWWLDRASACARTLRWGLRDLTASGFLRLPIALPVLFAYLCRVPSAQVRLSNGPAGRLIAEHLGLRRWGVPRFRLAQGVLLLPPDFSVYVRGRSRQAVRTNVRHARRSGIRVERVTMPDWTWTLPDRKLTQAAPTERWRAINGAGAVVGEAWLTVDERCALLHELWCGEPYGRWLLHTEIVRRLCASLCPVLLTNSFDAPLMPPGQQHFQRLLGYTVARVRPQPIRRAENRGRVPIAMTVTIAAGAIVAAQALRSPIDVAGHQALLWLTALVAVRVATDRAGWATLVGAIAAIAIVFLEASPAPTVPLAYFLCGIALDLQLSLVPRLAGGAAAMVPAGVAVMFVTLIAPDFPNLGHDRDGTAWHLEPVLGAVAFGALSAAFGYHVGRISRFWMLGPGRPIVARRT